MEKQHNRQALRAGNLRIRMQVHGRRQRIAGFAATGQEQGQHSEQEFRETRWEHGKKIHAG
jgi:hypothetical protein